MLTKIVNGTEVTMSADEEATIRAQWAAFVAAPPPDQLDVWDVITLKVAFNHENRIRVLEGKPAITLAQFKTAVKGMLT